MIPTMVKNSPRDTNLLPRGLTRGPNCPTQIHPVLRDLQAHRVDRPLSGCCHSSTTWRCLCSKTRDSRLVDYKFGLTTLQINISMTSLNFELASMSRSFQRGVVDPVRAVSGKVCQNP